MLQMINHAIHSPVFVLCMLIVYIIRLEYLNYKYERDVNVVAINFAVIAKKVGLPIVERRGNHGKNNEDR